MGNSNKSNQLETRNNLGNRLLAFLTRGNLHPVDYNVMVLLTTILIMIAATLIVIRSLKKYRRIPHSRLITQPAKKLYCFISNNQIEDLSIETIYDPELQNSKSTVIWDKLVRELHYAADKCYMKKFADRCIQLVYSYPQLVNTKFGATGLTPFHRVCFHGEAELMRIMLKMGANPHLRSDAGENSICFASYYYLNKRGDQEVKNMICLHILHRAGCRLAGNSVWYDLLLEKAVRARKRGLIEWLCLNRKNPRSKQLSRSISTSI